jgi:hypothetical protein
MLQRIGLTQVDFRRTATGAKAKPAKMNSFVSYRHSPHNLQIRTLFLIKKT